MVISQWRPTKLDQLGFVGRGAASPQHHFEF
jgi:hypothetical protein